MSTMLAGRRVAILAADGVEQIELISPRRAVTDAGGVVDLISLRPGTIQAMNHDLIPAQRFVVDKTVSEISVDEYDALVLPGGTKNPDNLRAHEGAVSFVREFVRSGKPVAAICHGPWSLVEADVVRGRTLTSYPSIRTDLRNAGANVVDEEVVVDDGIVSSRNPDDLTAFCTKLVEEIAEGPHRRRTGV